MAFLTRFEKIWPAAVALLTFLAAIALRWKILSHPIREGDEQIYKALVEYVLAGEPYSMRTHPLVVQGKIPFSVYGGAVFYHPPAGIYFFALFAKFWRLAGLKFAPLASFAIYYFAMLGCAYELFPRPRALSRALLPPLLAFSPILAHVSAHVWIDNVKVAFFAVFFYLSLRAARLGGNARWALAACAAVLCTLTKIDSLAAFPFALAIVARRMRTGAARAQLASVAMAALTCAAAWSVYAGAYSRAPSLPTPESFALSPYVWMTTIGTSPGEFVRNFFKIVTTVLPALFLLMADRALGRNHRREPDLGELLALWILGLVMIYWGLVTFGYAKLLRYLCLTVPASALLFMACLERFTGPRLTSPVLRGLLVLLLVGYAFEVGEGVRLLATNPEVALLEPLF